LAQVLAAVVMDSPLQLQVMAAAALLAVRLARRFLVAVRGLVGMSKN